MLTGLVLIAVSYCAFWAIFALDHKLSPALGFVCNCQHINRRGWLCDVCDCFFPRGYRGDLMGKTVHQSQCAKAAAFFKGGYNTAQIAHAMDMPEPKVVRLLDEERCERLGLLRVQYSEQVMR